MVLQDWYRDLARINRQIEAARELIERQKALVLKLGLGRESAIVLLAIFNDTLKAMIAHRTNILMFVRTFPLPTTHDLEAHPGGDEPCREHPTSIAQLEMEEHCHVLTTLDVREVLHLREMAATLKV